MIACTYVTTTRGAPLGLVTWRSGARNWTVEARCHINKAAAWRTGHDQSDRVLTNPQCPERQETRRFQDGDHEIEERHRESGQSQGRQVPHRPPVTSRV